MKKILFALTAVLLPVTAFAHVGYVIDKAEQTGAKGMDFAYLLSPFQDISNILLMIVTAIVVLGLIIYIQRFDWFADWKTRLLARLDTYEDYLPWMARLSLGIALIGAGTSEVLISPILPMSGLLATVQIVLGFCMFAGFLLVPVTLATIVLYIFALFSDVYILGNLDFLALALAFLALHSERPGFDDIFNFKVLYNLRLPREWAPIFLRFGIGVGMIYLALYEKILNPHMAALVVEKFHMTSAIPVSGEMWVLSTGIIELMVGLCLLFGWYTRLVSLIAVAVLSMSFFFFKESVTSHVTLFGLLVMLFTIGGGKWSLDQYLSKRAERGAIKK